MTDKVTIAERKLAGLCEFCGKTLPEKSVDTFDRMINVSRTNMWYCTNTLNLVDGKQCVEDWRARIWFTH